MKSGRPIIDFLKLSYLANRPPMLEGLHGVGKSELFEQAARELGIGFLVRDLSLLEAPDLIGLPRSSENGQTIYHPPAWLPADGKGFLLFEELNRSPRYVRSPCLQLLTARTLNDYRLPDGWLPAAAINPADAGGYDVDELDDALLSRFDKVTVSPDRREWVRWAKDNGIYPIVIQYVESDPQIFKDPTSNPRSWKYVSDILHTWFKLTSPLPRSALRAHIEGRVGVERARAFLRFMAQPEVPLNHTDVFGAYPEHRPLVQAWVQKGKLDMIQVSADKVCEQLQSPSTYQRVRNGKGWKHLGMFLSDLPPDLREKAEEFFKDRGYHLP